MPGASIREIKIDGTVVCEVDDNSDVPADVVLAVGGQNGVYVDRINMSKVIVFANTSYLQKRVQGIVVRGRQSIKYLTTVPSNANPCRCIL